MNEIEVKILNIDLKKIKKKLKEFGAKKIKNVLQIDRIYQNKTNKGILVRIRQEGKRFYLTIKGKKIKSKLYKIRPEYEIEIPSLKFGEDMLKTLGFDYFNIGEKKRLYYKYRNCSVEIIKIPNFPEFLEIEGSGKNIDYIAQQLGFKKKDFYTLSIENLVDFTNKKFTKF